MRFIISPARGIKTGFVDMMPTKPLFTNETRIIANELKSYAPWELESILRVNGKIAVRGLLTRDPELGSGPAPL